MAEPNTDQDVQLFRASSGNWSARTSTAKGSQLVHSAIHPECEGTEEGWPVLHAPVVVCLGTGLGWHLRNLATRFPGERTWILVDESPALIAHTLDQGGLCGTLLAASPETFSQERSRIARHLSMVSDPTFQVLVHPARQRQSQGWLAQVLLQVLDMLTPGETHHSTQSFPDERLTLPILPVHLQPAPVWIPRQGHFLERELERAFSDLGLPVNLQEDSTVSAAQWNDITLRTWQRERPCLALSVNAKGIDSRGELPALASQLGIPFAIWFVDDPRPILSAFPESMSNHLQAFCWERAYLPWLQSQGFASVHWLPLAGDPQLFVTSTVPVSQDIDVSFVGSSLGSSYQQGIKRRMVWNPAWQPFVDKSAESLLRGTGDVLDPTRGTSPATDRKAHAWLDSLIIHTASFHRRRLVLDALCSLGLEVFGDREGWAHALPKVPSHPEVDYAQGLCAHYQRTRINLSITSAQMPTGLNQRSFDVPLSGGFLLQDAQSDLMELFDPHEYAAFSNSGEAFDLAKQYLANPEARIRIAQASSEAVRTRHTYTHRARQILNSLGIHNQ